MIAEEVWKFFKNDVKEDIKEAAKEIATFDKEEYLTPKDVSRILGWSPWTVRKKKDELKCYVTINGRIFFVKSQLHKMIVWTYLTSYSYAKRSHQEYPDILSS